MTDISTSDIEETARMLGVRRNAAPPVSGVNPSYLVMPDDVAETARMLGVKAPAAPATDEGFRPKNGKTISVKRPGNLIDPGVMEVAPGGKVNYQPAEVFTPKEQAEGAKRGAGAQYLGSIPIAGPLINMGTAALSAKAGGQSFGDAFSAQEKADRAFALAHPYLSTGAQLAGGMTGYGALGLTAPGRVLMGAQGPSTAARVYAGTVGGAGLGAADAALRGENPLSAAEIGAFGGFAGPTIGEGARGLTRGVLARNAPTGVLSGTPSYGLDLLVNRGLGSMTPGEIAAARASAGPHAMLGDLTPGLRDITKGIGAVQGPGKDVVERAYEAQHAGARGRLEDIMTRYFGPRQNIVDYRNMVTEERAKAADPLYSAWRATQVQPTQKLKELLPRLDAAGAFNAAEELAGISGTKIDRNFFTPDPKVARSGVISSYPTTETWDLVKQGLDRRIDAAYSAGDKRLASRLIGLKGEMVGEIEKTPAGQIWKRARQEFADRSSLLDQMAAGRDTFLGGRSGLSADELGEEMRHLSGPEKAARIIGLRSAIAEDMGATTTGDARMQSKILAPNNQDKIRLILGDKRGNELINEVKQERFLRERYPDVIPNKNTGASTVARGEAADLFRAPEPMGWELTKPTSYPLVGRLMPQNVIQDLRVAGRARSAPALASLLTTSNASPQMDELIAAMTAARDRYAGAERIGGIADRGVSALVAGPTASTYRRYYENQRGALSP